MALLGIVTLRGFAYLYLMWGTSAMASTREQVLSALHGRLVAGLSATVRRNEALPEKVPAAGLVILRDGEPGEPDVTLNPRTEYYSHRVELELLVTQPSGGGEVMLDDLVQAIGAALAPDPSLGGLAENLTLGPPEVATLAIEGAAPILAARLVLTVEYLVSDTPAA
jgi:hypothetical protein